MQIHQELRTITWGHFVVIIVVNYGGEDAIPEGEYADVLELSRYYVRISRVGERYGKYHRWILIPGHCEWR